LSDKLVFETQMDMRWIKLAEAMEPFTLKNMYIKETQTSVPLDTKASMKVQPNKSLKKVLAKISNVTEIDEEMRVGVRPVEYLASLSARAQSSALILIHGYCTASNPWTPNANLFENGYFFLDKSNSISNDAFAKKIVAFCETHNLGDFSVIGHSQGGMVGTHLRNYYWSGLDGVSPASDKRIIQSLGTPYQGCSMAGSAANLGKVFGVGCGTNNDLAPDGARLWLSGISMDTRKLVHYYTTSYQQGKLFGDYCNMAVNAVLQWPNDGVTENVFTPLVGGNNEGNVQKQCHTTEMGYTAQYYDNTRNSVMNKFAARK